MYTPGGKENDAGVDQKGFGILMAIETGARRGGGRLMRITVGRGYCILLPDGRGIWPKRRRG